MARKKARRGPDGLLLPQMMVTFRCRVCAVKFKAKLYADDPDPACPNLDCGVVQTPIGLDVAAGRAPSVGGSLTAKATDMAAEMVMQDHGMTDLQDAKREGDTMAPKLSIAQQRIADGMFDPKARAAVFGGQQQQQNNPMAGALNRIARNGMGAAQQLVQHSNDYRDPIAPLHAAKTKPRYDIIHRG
jgi:hypothetical protein